jgi:hypothetical protein
LLLLLRAAGVDFAGVDFLVAFAVVFFLEVLFEVVGMFSL